MTARFALIVLVAACGDSDSALDASSDLEVTVSAAVLLEGAIPDGLVFTVNGEAGEIDGGVARWQMVFPDYESALATELVFEARSSGNVLDRVIGPRCVEDCPPAPGDAVVSEVVTLCGYPQGELRVHSVSCDYLETGGCVADSFCVPR